MGNAKLSKAVRELNVHEVQRLLASGKCSINKQSAGKPAPIILCVSEGLGRERVKRGEIMKLLVHYGADLNVQCETRSWLYGKTATMIAAERGYFECLQVLVAAGADLSITNPCGDTALILAIRWGEIECAKLLIDKMSVDLLNHKNGDGENAFILTASNREYNYFLCLKRLVEAGAETDIRDKDGNTALMLSVSLGQEDRVKYLINHMPRSTLDQRNHEGQTALMLAASTKESKDCLMSLQHLLEAAADFNVEDKKGNTALTSATKSGNSEAVRLLLEKGAVDNSGAE
ncbi:ankyrin repeat-containing protein [Elysia marginata]|uniref:Ankyrin repeat-containing protein n=1 Tax=Elysia marginata TaxID=1093978 RepID=A0AAV4EMA5_9GAST|nr:ankyrin repeat-containing protein [Elysia marginata]